MPRIRDVHVYPYSGWPDRPWSAGSEMSAPFEPDVLDLDAAARSARRVTEELTRRLRAADIESKRGSYRIFMRSVSETNAVEVDPSIRFARDGFLGSIKPPRGFSLLLPDQRAEAIASAVSENLQPLAALEGWDDELNRVIGAAREAQYDCSWVSDWKSTRDRSLRARLAVTIEDDGYGRWLIEVANAGGELLRSTERMFGWAWLSNFEKMAKTMAFSGPHTLVVDRESMFLGVATSIDLDTAVVWHEGDDVGVGDVVLSYPGEPGRPSPAVVSEVVADLVRHRVVRRDDGTAVSEAH